MQPNLTDYRLICAEIEELRAEMKKLRGKTETAVVKGSYPDFPFTEHSVKVQGVDDKTLGSIAELQSRIDSLVSEKREIESFAQAIPDRRLRKIIRLKYLEPKPYKWREIAQKVGSSEDAVRMACKRFLKTGVTDV